jgi:peptidoglycan hydrolase CwlO-like protein
MDIESAVAVQTAIMERVEKKLDDIGEHNGKQDILIAQVSAQQKSTQAELDDHKDDTGKHPNGGLPNQVKTQWWFIGGIVTVILGLAFFVIRGAV